MYSILTWYSQESDGVIQTTVGIVRIVGFIYSVVNPIILYYFNWPIDDECDFQNCLLFCRCAKADNEAQNAPMELIDISKFATGNADSGEAIPLGTEETRIFPEPRIVVTSPNGQDIRLQ